MSIKYDAILRNLELIGEAATYVPAEVREQHAEIPWRQVIATRNRLIHAYLGIDNDTLWSIVNDDVEPLIAGFAMTAAGWVQKRWTRCNRPGLGWHCARSPGNPTNKPAANQIQRTAHEVERPWRTVEFRTPNKMTAPPAAR